MLHDFRAWLLAPVLSYLQRIERQHAMDMVQLTAALNGVADELTKATAEIVAAVASSGTTTPAVDAAVAKLQALAKALDDLNPDTPAPAPADPAPTDPVPADPAA